MHLNAELGAELGLEQYKNVCTYCPSSEESVITLGLAERPRLPGGSAHWEWLAIRYCATCPDVGQRRDAGSAPLSPKWRREGHPAGRAGGADRAQVGAYCRIGGVSQQADDLDELPLPALAGWSRMWARKAKRRRNPRPTPPAPELGRTEPVRLNIIYPLPAAIR